MVIKQYPSTAKSIDAATTYHCTTEGSDGVATNHHHHDNDGR
jgi:hypothetical protein